MDRIARRAALDLDAPAIPFVEIGAFDNRTRPDRLAHLRNGYAPLGEPLRRMRVKQDTVCIRGDLADQLASFGPRKPGGPSRMHDL